MYTNNLKAGSVADVGETHFKKGLEAWEKGDARGALLYFQNAIDAKMNAAEKAPEGVRREHLIEEIKTLAEMCEDLKQVPTRVATKVRPEELLVSNTGVSSEGPVAPLAKNISLRFDDIVGLDEAKRVLQTRMVNAFKYPDVYANYKLKAGGGLLLYGPPGTGKTELAAAAAAELDADFYNVEPGEIKSKWVGEGEKNVAKLFESIRERSRQTNKPAILFIDEVHTLFSTTQRGSSGGSLDQITAVFQKELDGIQTRTANNTPLFFMIATNFPEEIPPAITSRIRKRGEIVYVPLPNEEDRKKIFMIKHQAEHLLAPDVDWDRLAKQTEGLSGRDIDNICEKVRMRAATEEIETGKKPVLLTQERFEAEIEASPSLVDAEYLAQLEAFGRKAPRPTKGAAASAEQEG